MTRSPEDMEVLMSACLDGWASHDEFRELDEILRTSAECRKAFFELSVQGLQIRRFLNERKAALEAGESAPVRFRAWRILIPVAAAASVAVAVGLSWWVDVAQRQDVFVARVAGKAGEAYIVTLDREVEESRTTIATGDEIRAGTTVAVGGGASLMLACAGDDTTISLSNGALAEIAGEDGHANLIRLKSGVMTANVVRHKEGRAVVVATPQSEMMVIGTRFSVTVARETTRLDVEKGVVRIRSKGKEEFVDINEGGTAIAGSEGLVIPGRLIRTLCGNGAWANGMVASGIAVGNGHLWAIRSNRGVCELIEVNPEEDTMTGRSIGVGTANTIGALAFDGRDFWVSTVTKRDEPVLMRVNSISGEILEAKSCSSICGRTILPLPFDFCSGFLWIGVGRDLYKVDPETLQVSQRVKCPWPIGYVAAGREFIYAAASLAGQRGGRDAIKFDSVTGNQKGVFRMNCTVVSGDMAVFVARNGLPRIWAIDLTNNQLTVYEAE